MIAWILLIICGIIGYIPVLCVFYENMKGDKKK